MKEASFTKKNNKYEKGYVALISVLIIGVVGVVISVSLLLLGIGQSKTSFSIDQSNQAKALADSCTFEALERIRLNSTYTGSGSITIGTDSCSFTVTNLGGTSREIQSTGTVDTVIRKVELQLDQVSPINVVTWTEVADF
jgi:hypothetical protein